MTRSLAAALVLIGAAAAVPAQETQPPPLLYAAFERGGPIVSGTITAVSATEITLRLGMKMRGDVEAQTIAIEYSSRPNPKRPPMLWERVSPAIGRNVLVFLQQDAPPWRAVEVLNLDAGESRWIPLIRRMLELSRRDAGVRTALLAATADPSPLIRTLAFDRLLNELCVMDVPCRRDLLSRAYSVAKNGAAGLGDRIDATRTIGLKIYDGSAPGGALNATVLADLFDLTASDADAVRGEAIQILDGYFFGAGAAKPAIPPLDPTRRQQIRNSLEAEVRRGSAVSRQAANLARLLGER